MKRIIAVLVGAILLTSAVSLAQTPAEPAAPPVFTLEAGPGDSPELTAQKAALRLFKAFNVAREQLLLCRAQNNPGADPALRDFVSRNGNTLVTLMSVIKKFGGLTPEIKAALDRSIKEAQANGPDCAKLIARVAGGGFDLYKAPEYAADYQLIQPYK
ncbi:MAG: hypothetical protein LBP55_02475 [Candidatus Adiutrix sp.]|jgi:hypothetical protein|nr:hypothetical protein [Candidatus Adiutrix sp.]